MAATGGIIPHHRLLDLNYGFRRGFDLRQRISQDLAGINHRTDNPE
jgi:hypothetical protein